MQTVGYAMMIIAKFFIGFVLSRIPFHFRHRSYFFSGLLTIIGTMLIGVCGLGMFHVSPKVLGVAFVVAYAVIKVVAATIRPIVLSICHIDVTLSGHREIDSNSGKEDRVRTRLSWATSAIQCLSCVGDVLGKLIFTGMAGSDAIRRLASKWHVPTWTLSMMTLGSLNILTVCSLICFLCFSRFMKHRYPVRTRP